jgi:F0F1-type ATP synthase membrane subunit b/b'
MSYDYEDSVSGQMDALRQQLAEATRERDEYKAYAALANATVEDIGANYRQQLATVTQAVWEEAIVFVDHHSNDEELIQAMREQAKAGRGRDERTVDARASGTGLHRSPE